jgi:hypothetical protein
MQRGVSTSFCAGEVIGQGVEDLPIASLFLLTFDPWKPPQSLFILRRFPGNIETSKPIFLALETKNGMSSYPY